MNPLNPAAAAADARAEERTRVEGVEGTRAWRRSARTAQRTLHTDAIVASGRCEVERRRSGSDAEAVGLMKSTQRNATQVTILSTRSSTAKSSHRHCDAVGFLRGVHADSAGGGAGAAGGGGIPALAAACAA